MRKNKFLIASVFLIILMIMVFIPRPIEKIYIVYDQNEIQCNSNITRENKQKDSYLICEGLKFINFIKHPEKVSRIIDLDKIDKFNIITNRILLERFNNDNIIREKYDFDLLDRKKKFNFYLIIKDSISRKAKIIPVVQTRVFCSLKLID